MPAAPAALSGTPSDWMADLLLALDSCTSDGSDLTQSDRMILARVHTRLLEIRDCHGGAAAQAAFRAVIAILVASEDDDDLEVA